MARIGEYQTMSGGNTEDGQFDCIRRHCHDGPWSSKKALKRHIKTKHPLRCAVCGEPFGVEKDRTEHVLEEHDL